MAITKLKGRQLSFAGAGAFTGSNGAANGVILDNGSGLVFSASRVYLAGVPQEDLEAATKSYVDAQTGTGGVAARGIVFGDPDGTGFSSNNAFVVDSGYTGIDGGGPFDVKFDSATGSFSINAKSFQVTGSANNAQAITFLTDQGSSEKITFTNTQGTDAGAISLVATAGGILLDQDSATKKIHLDSEGSVDIDAGDNITLDAADDISLTTTSEDGLLTLHSAHTAGVAVLIDANADAGSILDIDAGIIDADTQGEANFTAAGALVLSSSNNAARAVQIGASGGTTATLHITSKGTAANAIDIDTDGGVAIDAGGTFSVDGVGASNVTTNGALTLSGSTGLNLKADSGTLDIETRQGAIDVDAGTTLSLDGASGINIGTQTDVAIDVDSSTFDLDASGAITIDSTSTFSIDGEGASNVTTNGALTLSGSTALNLASDGGEIDITSRQGAIDINSTSAAVTIDAAAASSFNTSAGDLTINAAANDAKVVIKGDHEGDVAIHIDGNANASSIVDIDAGELDIDASGGINITSAENAADAIVINSGQGGIDITAAGAAGEDIDISNTAGSVNITAGEADGDGIKINANHATSGINMQLAGNLVASVNPRGFVIAANQALVSDGATLALTGAISTSLPKYFYNQATVTSGTLDTNFGRVVAGDGILSASVAGSTNLAKGISLLTSSLRIMGGGPGSQSMLVPESLQIYQNGLLLTSGVNADYEIVNYNYLSSSVRGLDIKLKESGVVGDVYTVFLQSQMKGD